MSSRNFSMKFKVVFYRESGRFIAHALEFDLIGDGDTHEEALECLGKAIGMQVDFAMESTNGPAVLFRQAPPEIVAMFAAGRAVVNGLLKISVQEDGCDFSGDEFRDADIPDGELVLV